MDRYNSEAFLTDLLDGFDMFYTVADIGETFSYQDGHAVKVETPSGKKFLIHVKEIEDVH